MFVVLDIETSKLPHASPWDVEAFICSIGLEHENGQHYAWLLNHVSEPMDALEDAKDMVQRHIDSASLLVMHNAKFDLTWLIHLGIQINVPVWCTMTGDYILFGQNPDVELSLNACCKRRQLPVKKDFMADYWQQGFETNEIPWQDHKDYLLQDVHITRLLYEQQRKELNKAHLTNICQVNSEISRILAQMEYNGIKFNKDRAIQLRQEYKDEAEELRLLMFEYTGFEFLPTSSTQLQTVLFGGEIKRIVNELVAKRRKNGTFRVYTRKQEVSIPFDGLGMVAHSATFNAQTGSYSTGKKARALMECPNEFTRSFKRLLDRWALVNKAWSTVLSEDETKGWLTKVQLDGRIHPTFNTCFTRTGRLSSSNPNGQNLPRYGAIKLKEIFEQSQGYLLNCDLSQIEWRMAAALSEDKVMCNEIIQGLDCHTENGEAFFGGKRTDPNFKKEIRQPCKVFNFRMIYGGGPQAYATDPEMPHKSLAEWKTIVQGFKDKYTQLTAWQKRNLRTIEKNKYLRNVTGRVLTFHYNANPDEGIVGYSPTSVCNYPVQSVSADLMFIMLIEMDKFIRKNNLKTKMLLQVHDSLVFDTTKEEAYIIARHCLQLMADLPNLSDKYYGWKPGVPIEGEATLGYNYGQSLIEVKLKDIEKLKEITQNDSDF